MRPSTVIALTLLKATSVVAGLCRPHASGLLTSTGVASSEAQQLTESVETSSTASSSETTATESLSSVDSTQSSETSTGTEASSSTTAIGSESTETSTSSTATASAGPAVILAVQQQRRLQKRVIGGFVGDNNPDSCTFASSFQLVSDELLEQGVAIYYSGEDYKELRSQDAPPADSITKTFSVFQDVLQFNDPSLPNGGAGFCQDPNDGQVYITFTSRPSGCIAVSLIVYKAELCQNGQIIDIGVSSSVSSATTPEEATGTTDISAATAASASICNRGVGGNAGDPPLTSRLSDCKELDVVTVSPYTVTTTKETPTLVVRIPTGFPTKRQVLNQLTARAEGEPTATTIYPTAVPTYATYCDSPEAYYSACSQAGITPSTTTLPTPTTTKVVTTPACPMRRMVKRGGEAMGYEFEDGWDAYNMPGYRLF
ncbi:hypothetical protein NM208_g13758 [Fusarium decemcellulare]|uniref:Uncharacterized protein n=1 Tax=Fusarium decemcellulare TaxID=57161 RepID=A0ACC1RM37_9HYPO|nr:hypothetical protein NM208_g13758 [Fusarium decemcellulare]